MSGRALLLLVLFTSFACSPASAPRPAVVPAASPLAATGRPDRVVLLSLDGLGADLLTRQSGLTAFDHLARTGAAARVIPVNPTLTAPTHASILTGADPQVHGIVSNAFHLPGTPVEKTARGMDVEITAETIVEAARRQGKRVGAVPFPAIDAATDRRRADFGLIWTTSLTPGRLVNLTRADFRREWVPPTWTQRPQRRASHSPLMRARVEWSVPGGPRADVDVIAYDTTNDGAENYDTFTVEAGEQELVVDARGWFAVARDHHGSWSRILSTSPSLDVTLYWGAISRTRAYPDSYRELLDREVGFWPGVPDEQTEIDPGTFAEQLERLSAFLTRAQSVTIQRMQFDLLLAYQPVIDQSLHNFLGYDDAVVHRAFVAADRAAATLGGLLDANRDALLICGDHGLVPVERQLRMGRLLADKGLAPRWRAYASHSVAHLYRTGAPDDTAEVVNVLTASGFFERVERKGATSHPNSGDIVVTAHPAIGLTASDREPMLAEPDAYGHHGALNTHRELHTVLFASGFGVPKGNLGEISQMRIARFISQLLGIQPPRSAE